MATPGSGIISMSQIRDALGGTNDLAWYRGRTYYRNGSPVVISQNPSMAEFYGLSNVAPLDQDAYSMWVTAEQANAFIQVRWWPTQNNIGIHGAAGCTLQSWSGGGAYNPALYTNFSYTMRINSGCCVGQFVLQDGDPNNVLHYYDFPNGSSVNLSMHVTAQAL